jgi:hypothetical protein
MQYMAAVLLAQAKEVRDDGTIVEIVVWELPDPLPPSTHRYKYRLYYGAESVRGCEKTSRVSRPIGAILV